ncbi:MAG: hypothetical protein H7Z14_10885 [Anaerolineae bacterium]|nr:hypothetical protein [Phycisphaerae bacterium]
MKFLTAANWNDVIGADDNTLPGPADRAIINNNFVVSYDTAATTSVNGLIIGADWPVTGETGTDGTLNMTAGKIIVTGGGDSFALARARGAVFGDANGDGVMNMTNSELQIGGSDPIVGVRDRGVLDIGLNAKVYNTPGQENYWRLGNYGPSIDAGLEGNGLLNVHANGTFNAHVIFIGDNDATGELRVSDTASVVLTGNLVPRPSGPQALGSATVRMIGSTATLSAFNLESDSTGDGTATKYIFDADLGGVSEIKLQDAINITASNLEVNLGAFVMPPFTTLLLFDGDQALVGNRIFGTFANFSVNGVLNPTNYLVQYNQVNGDITLNNTPEPTAAVAVLGLAGLLIRRRRA